MRNFIYILGSAIFGLVPAVAEAQQSGADERVAIELNKLEQVEDACRIYLVARNDGSAYDSFKLDIVLFDTAGVIASRVAVTMAPLRAGRPTVQLFDVQGQDCAAIGSLLVNEVLECRPADAAADCLGRVEVSSRTDVDILR